MINQYPESWWRVDQNLRSLRASLQKAESTEDFQQIGHLSREVIYSLAEAICDNNKGNPKEAISAFFQARFPGESFQELRSYGNSSYKLANALQHHRSASYIEAELCAEACIHLVTLIRIIVFTESSPPNQRFRGESFASAESDFITSCISHNFGFHPIAKDNAFRLKLIQFQGPYILLSAEKGEKQYTVSVQRPYWWKSANRASADRLLDDFFVLLLTELEKERLGFSQKENPK